MRSPLADEEELLRLVTEGRSQSEIAERKGVSREAVRQRLVKLRPLMEARGIVVHDGRGIRRDKWIPWSSMPERWRQHYAVKHLRLLGRTFDGPSLSEDEQRKLEKFLNRLDAYPPFKGGRGVIDYQGPDTGIRIVPRQPWDRGYVRWPDDVSDDRLLPPQLVMPDEGIPTKLYEDKRFAELWALTDLPLEERYERVLELRDRHTRPGDKKRNAS